MSKRLLINSYLLAFILILMGGLIYLCYRPMSLRLFRWAHLTASTQWITSLRRGVPSSLPDWVIYALPDGLWACSYAIFIGTLWNFSLPKCLPFALIIPVIGVASELLQKIGMLPGVYDTADLLSYSAGGILGVGYIYFANKFISNYNY